MKFCLPDACNGIEVGQHAPVTEVVQEVSNHTSNVIHGTATRDVINVDSTWGSNDRKWKNLNLIDSLTFAPVNDTAGRG